MRAEKQTTRKRRLEIKRAARPSTASMCLMKKDGADSRWLFHIVILAGCVCNQLIITIVCGDLKVFPIYPGVREASALRLRSNTNESLASALWLTPMLTRILMKHALAENASDTGAALRDLEANGISRRYGCQWLLAEWSRAFMTSSEKIGSGALVGDRVIPRATLTCGVTKRDV